MPITCVFRDTSDDVAVSAAEFIAAQAHSAIEATGECLIALAGGSTPVPTYRRLRCLDIDWAKVHFVQTDERLTASADGRTAALIETTLGLDSPEHLAAWHPIPVNGDAASIAAAYAAQLAALRADGGPDIAVLGLGVDGHTASLFSHNVHSGTGDRVVSTLYHGEPRISLGLDYLRAIPTRVLLATGASKRAALGSVLSPEPGAAPVPAALVLGEDGYVFADAAARPERD
ncbi:6-phosphogluconolactonase [Nocardia transvalensis]|uniref:6-phosphogluconolactonase n=1 Tax=Nocardia transvalensis TaxID=37333 RepID=UPI001894B78B|nr:6-phosphogluconolactonase [Nocardia transvalensis]MBF6333201.1 6-phosphogluconolactonase [Nocardia transvalensis]